MFKSKTMSTKSYPNPTKQIKIKYPIEKIKEVIRFIPKATTTVKLTVDNNAVNYFQYSVMPNYMFNLGMLLDVNLSEESESETSITLESKRKVGAIDSEWEYEETSKLITDFINLLGKGLEGKLSVAVVHKQKSGAGLALLIAFGIIGIIVAVFAIIIYSKSDDQVTVNSSDTIKVDSIISDSIHK